MSFQRILGSTFAILFTACAAAAQLPGASEGWHLNGAVGFGYNSTSQRILTAAPGAGSTSNYNTAAGDLRLNLNGFVKDPLLLPFAVNFDGIGGNNNVDVGSYSNTVFNWGFNTTFLPAGPAPLHVFYQKSDFGSSGVLFGQNANTSNLGVNWTVRKQGIPHLDVDYTRFSNSFNLATSLFSTNFKQDKLALSASDNWHGWDWIANYENYRDASNFANFVSLPSNYTEHLNIFGGRVRRLFWDGKAEFSVDDRSELQTNYLPGFGSSRSSDSYTETRLKIKHTEKLSSTYFYDFTHVTTGQALGPTTGIALPGTVSILTVPSFNSHYAGARVTYQWTNSIRIFQEARYQYVTPPSYQFQFQQSLWETLSGIGYQKSWRGFDLDGAYTGHFQVMGTNLGRHTNTFSNDLFGRVAWGKVERVRLSVSGDYSKLNLVQLLNGFSEDRRIRAQVETKRWGTFLFRVTGERSYIELLNLSGDFRQSNTGYGFQVEHPRFTASLSRTLQEGAGALFPSQIQDTIAISEPLPLNLLLGTPLLNSADHTTAGIVVLRLRRNLDISADYRNESDVLAETSFRYRLEDARLHYRLGKVYLEFAYGIFKNESFGLPQFSGLNTHLLYIRISRDFKFF